MLNRERLDEVLEAAAARAVALPPPAVRRILRVGAHLSQEDLGEVLGVRRATVARWELGLRDPRGALRVSYADALRALARAPREGRR